jgi:hypothetical protein
MDPLGWCGTVSDEYNAWGEAAWFVPLNMIFGKQAEDNVEISRI